MLNRKKSKGVIVLLVLVLVALIVSAVLMSRFMQSMASKPCLTIPTRFILENPECAEKLIQAANVSNVRIVSLGASGGGTSSE